MKTLIVALLINLMIAQAAFALTANLSWQDNSNNEDGFRIHTADNPEFTINASVLGTVGPNVTVFSDPNTYAGKCYKVLAFNTVGVSPFTNAACVGPVPVGPGGLVIVVTP